MTDRELLREAVKLLNRYWREVPLGNQPHMIAANAENLISDITARLSEPAEDVVMVPRDEWLPIETAPNDVAILVCRESGDMELVSADDNDFRWTKPEKRIRGIDQCTHWRHPPAPPAQKDSHDKP